MVGFLFPCHLKFPFRHSRSSCQMPSSSPRPSGSVPWSCRLSTWRSASCLCLEIKIICDKSGKRMLSWSQRFFHPVPLLFHALRQGVLQSPHRLILPAKLHSQCFFQNDMLRPEFLDTVSLSCHPEAFLPTASHDFLLPLQWCQSHSHQCGWTHILHSSRHRILLPHILTPQTCSP